MAINPLPEAAFGLINSAQVLTTATSLVKELVDNALDAKATFVEILISQNTLDKIEVRDNGHGIPKEDLDFLGRRGHTSKIRSYDEVRAIGGVSLGFRGEALSSAVQLADVMVTTKTEGEPVATCVKLKATGGVDNQSRTSHPVGTTVCVARFMHNLPVRKQNALKEAPKTLLKIKELLQAYALARPTIRFAVKVTKGGKGSWSFSPRPNDELREVISLVIGRAEALQCIETVMDFPDVMPNHGTEILLQTDQERSRNATKNRFLVEAFLPKSNADAAKIGQGQFISIDSRPVSCQKGTTRKIVVMFKSYIRCAFSDRSDTLKNPFLRLNIKCPPETYDPNVEPAKDDVIFANEVMILESIEKLFMDVYGELRKEIKVARQKVRETDNFELFLARRSVLTSLDTAPPLRGSGTPEMLLESPATSTSSMMTRRGRQSSPNSALSFPKRQDSEMLVGSPTASASSFKTMPSGSDPKTVAEEPENGITGGTRRRWDHDMSLDCAESVEEAQPLTPKWQPTTVARDQRTEPEVLNGQTDFLNPWVIAKMTAPVLHTSSLDVSQSLGIATPPSRSRTNFLRTPQTSSDLFLTESGSHPTAMLRQPKRRMAFGLETPLSNLRHPNNFVLAGDLIGSTPSSSQPAVRHESFRQLMGFNKPFVSPVRRDGETTTGDCRLLQTTLSVPSGTAHIEEANSNHTQLRETGSELAWAMDFEHRKEDATRRRREELRAARAAKEPDTQSAEQRQSPHKNRYNAAIAALETRQSSPHHGEAAHGAREPLKTTLPDGDPRAYLMRQQKSIALQAVKDERQARPMHAKSTRLPLEIIPANNMLHNVGLSIPADISSLRGEMTRLAKDDVYISRGGTTAGLPMESLDREVISERVREAVTRWVETGTEYEVEYRWENLVNAK